MNRAIIKPASRGSIDLRLGTMLSPVCKGIFLIMSASCFTSLMNTILCYCGQ